MNDTYEYFISFMYIDEHGTTRLKNASANRTQPIISFSDIRELQEEIGYEPSNLTYLGEFYLSPGFCNEAIHLYLAEDLKYNPKDPDDDEFIEIIKVPVNNIKENFLSYIKDNSKMHDAKTLLGISLYLLSRKI